MLNEVREILAQAKLTMTVGLQSAKADHGGLGGPALLRIVSDQGLRVRRACPPDPVADWRRRSGRRRGGGPPGG
jgi:hypothetical protein